MNNSKFKGNESGNFGDTGGFTGLSGATYHLCPHCGKYHAVTSGLCGATSLYTCPYCDKLHGIDNRFNTGGLGYANYESGDSEEEEEDTFEQGFIAGTIITSALLATVLYIVKKIRDR